MNGGDGNDTIVGGRSFANVTAVNGGNGDDTLVSGLGNDNLTGGAGSNTLAYVSVSQGGLQIVNRTGGVLVRLPEPGTTGTGGTIGGQEQDVIHDDIRTLIGSNSGDFLIGSNVADTILGAAPVGTGSGVVDTPAGNDTIFGRGGDDTLVGGDRGQIIGGDGDDTPRRRPQHRGLRPHGDPRRPGQRHDRLRARQRRDLRRRRVEHPRLRLGQPAGDSTSSGAPHGVLVQLPEPGTPPAPAGRSAARSGT